MAILCIKYFSITYVLLIITRHRRAKRLFPTNVMIIFLHVIYTLNLYLETFSKCNLQRSMGNVLFLEDATSSSCVVLYCLTTFLPEPYIESVT